MKIPRGLAEFSCERHAAEVRDQHLRELEAAWHASGSVEDEAAWLLGRVRAGELERSRLELAALCGHRGASIAGGSPGVLTGGFATWVTRLGEHGQMVCLRAAIGVGSKALPSWRAALDQDQRGPESWPRVSLEAIEDWVISPSTKRERRSRAHARSWEKRLLMAVNKQASGEVTPRWPPPDPAVWGLGVAVSSAARVLYGHSVVEVVWDVVTGSEWRDPPLSECSCRDSVSSELVPWALGYRDPVRDRVEARWQSAGE